MYIQKIISHGKNGKEYSSIQLCKKYRMDGKIKTEVIINLSKVHKNIVVTIENSLKHGLGALVAAKDIVVRKAIDCGLVFLLVHYNWIMRNPAVAGKLGLDTQVFKVDDLCAALALVNSRQDSIEKRWFSHHGKSRQDNIFLYDLTSTYFEGTQNKLARFGHNRDKKMGKKQINIGPITNSAGFPLKIKVFEGNMNDHKTVLGQVANVI